MNEANKELVVNYRRLKMQITWTDQSTAAVAERLRRGAAPPGVTDTSPTWDDDD